MKLWKEAFWLAKFEWKASLVNIFLCFFVLSLFSLFYTMDMAEYIEKRQIAIDIFFLFFISCVPALFRGKHFQYNKISGFLWGSPTLIMQCPLPIPKEILVKSRLILYLAYSIPFAITFLTLLYILNSDIRTSLSAFAYIAFSIMWLSIWVALGSIMPASDVGDYVTTAKMIGYGIGMVVTGFAIITFFHHILGKGIVAYSLLLASQYPLIVILVSLTLVCLAWKYWQYYMKKTMKRMDYL